MANLSNFKSGLTRREVLKLASLLAPGVLVMPIEASTPFLSGAPFSVEFWDSDKGNFRAEVSGIASFIAGVPTNVTLSTTNSENITGGGDGAQVIITGTAILPKSRRTFDHYFNPNVFSLPAIGEIGNAWNGAAFYGPGVNNWDIVASKNFRIKERVDVQLRTETYNTFNHPQWSTVNNSDQFDPTDGAQVNSALGMITGDRGPRLMQLALRINF
jgi:hypothetical protein